MREFTGILRSADMKGLRSSPLQVRNVPYLFQAHNVRIEEHGIRPFEPVIDPFNDTLDVVFPFPQLFHGDKVTLLADEQQIQLVNDTWDTEVLVTVDPATLRPTAIQPGGVWHFVDLFDAWYLFNGSCVVFKTGFDNELQRPRNEAYVANLPTITTGCKHRGRIVTGGFDRQNFWNYMWTDIFDEWRDKFQWMDWLDASAPDDNFVVWSSIGGGDFPLWLIYPFDSNNARLKPTAASVIERIKRNEFGWMPLENSGNILRVAPLGKHFIAYGTQGIYALSAPAGRTDVADTYGKHMLKAIGILDRGSVGVSKDRHIFIDAKLRLWSIDPELRLQELDYREWMPDSETVITYDDNTDRFFLSDSDGAYLLDIGGLSSHNQAITSTIEKDGITYGLFEDLDIDDNAMLVTTGFDLQVRGIKTITSIVLGLVGGGTISVAVDYRYTDDDKTWSRTAWHPVNREGIAHPRIAGTDFRVVVRASDYTTFELDYIQVKWQSSDKRSLRGPGPTSLYGSQNAL